MGVSEGRRREEGVDESAIEGALGSVRKSAFGCVLKSG